MSIKNNAHAQSDDQNTTVNTQQLALLGKGLTPHNNKNLTLFFSCVGINFACNKIRAVQFNQSKNIAQWVGDEHTLIENDEFEKISTPEEKDAAIATRLNQLGRSFKHFAKKTYHNHHRGIPTRYLFVGAFSLSWLATGALILATGVSAYVFVPVLFTFYAIGCIVDKIGKPTTYIKLNSSTRYAESIQNHDGWNWSLKTKTVHPKMYQYFTEFAEAGFPSK